MPQTTNFHPYLELLLETLERVPFDRLELFHEMIEASIWIELRLERDRPRIIQDDGARKRVRMSSTIFKTPQSLDSTVSTANSSRWFVMTWRAAVKS